METTRLVFEFLAGGILVLLALASLALSLFPDLTARIYDSYVTVSAALDGSQFILVAALTAIAYAVGLVSQFIGERAFERQLDRIKWKRLTRYLEANHANLYKSPILKKYTATTQKGINLTKKEALACIGAMRFYAMMENPALSREIESQISRYRLLRVLFLVELLFISAIAVQICRRPSLSAVPADSRGRDALRQCLGHLQALSPVLQGH